MNDLVKKNKEEKMTSGLVSCQGCGATVAMRMVLKAFDSKTIVVIPACCWTIISGANPRSVFTIPMLHCAFETTAVVASGIARGLKIQGKNDIKVFGWAGDGGTFDIGFQSLSGAAERKENIIYICYDNEAYMNTGIQRSSSTPKGTWTSNTPINAPEGSQKKDIMAIMMAHEIPYGATMSIAYPEDLLKKVRRAIELNGEGLRFLHVLAPCPTGWKADPSKTIELARLAVETGIFPLYEFENSKIKKEMAINQIGSVPIKEYFSLQGRFSHLKKEDVEIIQKATKEKNNFLSRLQKIYK